MLKKDKEIKLTKKDWLVISVLGLLAVLSFLIKWPDGKTHVYFLDVGQGDATLIITPRGQQILVDGGPGQTILRRLSEIMPFYDRSLDLIVATHTDADHLTGLVDVLEHYQIKKILETGMACATSICGEWERLKPEEGAEIISAHEGEEIDFSGGVRFLVLHPFENLNGQKLRKTNNGGIVLKMLYGKQSVLLTADIEAPVETKLQLNKLNLDSNFLKVAHHGSKTSSTEPFLKAVTPRAAFIEVGRNNRYGHPTTEVLSRLVNLGIKYYRTDTDGTKELVLDGENYFIR